MFKIRLLMLNCSVASDLNKRNYFTTKRKIYKHLQMENTLFATFHKRNILGITAYFELVRYLKHT